MALSLKAVVSQQLLSKEGGGRIAVRELLLNVSAVANLIRENKVAQIPIVMQTHASAGMFTYRQNMRDLVKEGLVSADDADSFCPPEVMSNN